MVDDSERKFHGCHLIIAFINIINLKVLGGYGINVEKFRLDQFAFALRGLHL